MSQHIPKPGLPPPGLSSFTKIRLGWITTREAVLARPGETVISFLSPLSKKGERLVVKIPLRDGTYYLVENRQPLGFDRNLPDSGILILRVDPRAQEGYGTVEVMNADPRAVHFSRATFRLDDPGRTLYVDRKNGVAIVPLWQDGENLGVLVTTPEQCDQAVKAAGAIGELLRQGKTGGSLKEAMAAFRAFDFSKASALAAP